MPSVPQRNRKAQLRPTNIQPTSYHNTKNYHLPNTHGNLRNGVASIYRQKYGNKEINHCTNLLLIAECHDNWRVARRDQWKHAACQTINLLTMKVKGVMGVGGPDAKELALKIRPATTTSAECFKH